ncbi:MAG: SDR family oxidoreductase [Methylotenera sp.]|nr:SDR family oxidoreductase [Methylotenera sp.]MDD4925330.1 SDR family oxidoreductase [Methylotenera sp.]
MRILITGGLGFIGGRLGQYLHQAGHQVVLGSRNASSPPNWLPYAEVVKIDWNDDYALEIICNRVEVVIQAAGVNAQDCATDPIAALEVNGLATARLLEAARRAGVRRFVYLSTAHVYANPLVGIISEDTCPRNLHPYATSHLAGENVVLSANQRGQIEGVVLRLSNAFGAPAHKDVNCWMLLVNDLCRQAVTERRLTLQTAGLQRRDFVTLEDFGRALSHVIDLRKEQLSDGIFNVGGNWAPRVIDMVELIQSRCSVVLGFTPDIIFPEPAKGVVQLDLDYRTNKLIASGFKLSGNVEAEIDATLLFCRETFGDNQ